MRCIIDCKIGIIRTYQINSGGINSWQRMQITKTLIHLMQMNRTKTQLRAARTVQTKTAATVLTRMCLTKMRLTETHPTSQTITKQYT